MPKTPGTMPPAECYNNNDCPNDRKCLNERCVNPCTNSDTCGRGAFCHGRDHNAVCNCPFGYTGNPQRECIPRKCS